MENNKIVEIHPFIGNLYGTLNVKKEKDKFYCAVENWNGFYWIEIPKYLYDSLIRFKNDEK